MKICKICNLELSDDQFESQRHKCKSCRAKYNREHHKIFRENNKNKIKEQNAKSYQKNKEKRKINDKQYRENNKNKIKEYQKNYRKENEKLKINKRNYSQNNKNKRNAKEKEKRKNNLNTRLRSSVSALFSYYLKYNNIKKQKSFLKYLDYSIHDLKKYLESLFETWMNWNNYGIYDPITWNDNDQSTWSWQIDHIIAQSKLLFSSFEDANFKSCWALNNLRPYSAKQNIIDGARRTLS